MTFDNVLENLLILSVACTDGVLGDMLVYMYIELYTGDRVESPG